MANLDKLVTKFENDILEAVTFVNTNKGSTNKAVQFKINKLRIN